MQIEIKDKDIKTLAELAYIGSWMINAERIGKERIKKYDRVCDVILKQYLNSLSDKEKGDIKTVGQLHDYYMNELTEYADYYDEKTLIPRLAEKLTEINYPDGCGENFWMTNGIQNGARNNYEEVLEEKGFGVIRLDGPDFEERMAVTKEYWQLIYGKSDVPQAEREAQAMALAEAAREKYGRNKKNDNE